MPHYLTIEPTPDNIRYLYALREKATLEINVSFTDRPSIYHAKSVRLTPDNWIGVYTDGEYRFPLATVLQLQVSIFTKR